MEKHACLIFIWLMGAHCYLTQVAGNEVADSFISIDCGARADYDDDTIGFRYQTDENFIGTGTNHRISADVGDNNPYFGRQLETLRSFPVEQINCYTLKPKQQKNYKYLIRAMFAYGNYDNKNQPLAFDLYLGVNFWATVEIPDPTSYYSQEIILDPIDEVHVCLVNTGRGTPFISTLELRLLNNSIYRSSLPLCLQARRVLGSGLPSTITRYKDDVYDRMWQIKKDPSGDAIKATAEIRERDSDYKLPSEVLRTAVQSRNHSNLLYIDPDWANDTNVLSRSIALEYLKPVTLSSKILTQGYPSVRVRAAAESNAPPILSAFEIYIFVPQPNSPTDPDDVGAIMKIKTTYGLSRVNWQGEPCIPPYFAWDGLNCSFGNNSRIISLNLSSSKLTGQIATSFANLEKLESLDLSNNELTGQIPEFLAVLPNLKFLNLTGNKLTGSIPRALREKPDLQLSVSDNPSLY